MTFAELNHDEGNSSTHGRLIAGRYRLLDRIGRGRLGEIYEAIDQGYQDLGVGQHVAIQLLPDRVWQDRRLFDKLKLGYTALRALSHPNIVAFRDIGHDGKFGYLVMELLDGVSLRFVLDEATLLPLDEATPVIRAVGDALRFLHAKSIVHGRVTASNVFVTEDLEVQLLDVVSLNSADTILRGIASSDPLSRCDVGDDVYALACLTYEMLAGKHPFNFQTPSEARIARLEPARIEALSTSQWDALRRALSFDREQRTGTVTGFLHAFGIDGTERLQRQDVATTEPGPAPELPPRGGASPTHAAAPSCDANGSTHLSDDDRVDPPGARTTKTGRRRRRARRMPSPVLLVAVVGLAVWYVYGQPRDDIAGLIAYVDSAIAAGRAGTPAAVGKDRAASTGGEPEIGKVGGRAASTPSAQPVAAISAPAVRVDANETDEAATSPADEPSTAVVDATRSNDDVDAEVSVAAPPVAEVARSDSRSTLVRSFITLSERDGAVRITKRRPDNAASRVFWWTGDDTASADTDYIPIAQPVAGFTSGEEAETLHIPLVNDSVPEPPETFYVYLGQLDPQLGRLEPIARIRVDINDDD